MRIFWIAAILIFLGWACSSPKGVVKVEKNSVTIDNDSIEYELITFDSKFESWYIFHNSPTMFKSQAYYENWNRQYVSAWNFNATQASKGNFFEPIIGYEPDVDYGLEINHKLFYYFQYVENVLKIEILPTGPKAVPF